MQQVDACREVLEDPYGYVQRLKAETGRKVVGTFCSYAPEEIILAAGAHPLRLFGTGEAVRLAGAHLQSYCCSLVRGTLEDALAGRLAFLDGVVFPHTCDSIQRLSDLWRLNLREGIHLDVVLPVTLGTDAARDYLVAVLGRFRDELGEKLGTAITDGGLREAIRLTNRIRAAVGRIDALRSTHSGAIAGGDVDTLTRAAMVLDRSRAAELIEEAARAIEGRAAAAPAGRTAKRILLAGGVCNHPDVSAMIEEAGGAVVGDDLCTGARAFGGLIGEQTEEPIEAIARRLLSRVVCPAKHRGLTDRADHLIRLARERQAQGVILFLLKFCDPHAFDVPYLRETLTREGIPSLVLEVEDRLPADGQLRTRFEAFVEML
jgi:bcr-type benzoyl-CoA reductase subunit C